MLVYVAVMLSVVKRGLRRVASRENVDAVSWGAQLVVLAVLASSAAVTEWIGIHSLFGAFLTGALVPSDSGLSRALFLKIERPVRVFLLPVFFAFAGLRTEFGLLREPRDWLLCALVLAVAFLGKLGGTFVAARFTGTSARESAMLGVLMNTRGLMELVVLNVGMDLKIISPSLFATMVIMALVTTLAAGPLSRLADRPA
jgi:Kef-type K+ transport system membrane component KefB